MIKRILAIIIPLLTCATLVAQEKGNVWRTWYLKPVAEKIVQLEKGLKDHVEKFHGKGQWPEYYHDVLTGPNAGSLMGWSGPHTFKAMDERVRSVEDFKHWRKYVAPYVDNNTDGNISLVISEKDLSYKPKNKGPYWHLSYNMVRPVARRRDRRGRPSRNRIRIPRMRHQAAVRRRPKPASGTRSLQCPGPAVARHRRQRLR